MKRREFLKTAALSAAGVVVAPVYVQGQTDEHLKPASSSNAPALIQRAYGDTGIRLSIIGFGGLMLRRLEDMDYIKRLVAQSFEKGVNYYDVAPAYGDAEEKLGPALAPYRKKVFLACKTKQRTREGAEFEFKRSLERLQTDYFDLYQLHNIYDVEKDVDRAFMDDGAMKFLMEARKDGRIRHLGFSAHSVAAAMAAMERFDFDSLLFPFNFASFIKEDFGPQVMKKAQEKGVARIALKACIRERWTSNEERRESKWGWVWYKPLTDPREQELGLRFSLSQPLTAALPPMADQLYLRAIDIAMQYKPLNEEEKTDVAQLAQKMNPLFPREG